MTKRAHLGALLCAVLCASPAFSFTNSDHEAGASAPAGCWTSSAGAPARTSVARTPAPNGPLSLAWERELPGVIEAAPLVWQRRVFITLDRGAGTRSILALDLRSGEFVAEYQLTSSVPLDASVWGGQLAVHCDAGLRLLSWNAHKIVEQRTLPYETEIMGSILFEDELYVATRAALERRNASSGELEWRVEGPQSCPPALRGDDIYVLRDGSGAAHQFAVLDRATGAERGAIAVRFEDLFSTASIVALADSVYLGAGVPVKLADYEMRAANCLVLPRRFGPGEELHLPFGHGLHALSPAEWGEGWLSVVDADQLALLLCANARGSEGQRLAQPATDSEFFTEPQLPITVTGDVAYVGAGGFDLVSLKVLFKHDEPPRFRYVPATNTLLAVRGERTLTAFRPEDPPRTPIIEASVSGTKQDGRVLLADASIVEGSYEIAADEGLLRLTDRRRKTHPIELADVRLAETEEGTLAYAGSLERLPTDWTLLIEGEIAAQVADFAKQARTTNDVELMRALMQRAFELGSNDDFPKVNETIAKLEKRPRKAKRSKVERIAKALDEMERPSARLWRRYQALPEETSDAVRQRLLEGVLLADPEHAAARATVRAMLPAQLTPAGEFDALGWVELLQTLATHPAEVIVPAESEQSANDMQRELGRALYSWRDDLFALRSENLLILAPPTMPGSVARLLASAELICRALDENFGGEQTTDAAAVPLAVVLYESKGEYFEREGATIEVGSTLPWATAHYDAQANTSSAYLPASGELTEPMLSTLAHVLTHHWMRVRIQAASSDADRIRGGPGHWVAEGVAAFLEGFQFNIDEGTWETFDRRSERVDAIAHAQADHLLPWSKVLSMDSAKFHGLDDRPRIPVDRSWTLGQVTKLSKRNLFYDQAASTCHYLYHAEGGKHRAALAQYVRDYYSGDTEAIAIEAAFELSSDELGGRVKAFALETVIGR